jgi:hypothetical protein
VWSTLKGKLLPYLQTLDLAGKACQGQALVITKIGNAQSIITLGAGD